jgi:hypothetical protein
MAAEHAYGTGEWVLKKNAVYLAQQVIQPFGAQLATVLRSQYLHSVAILDRLLRIQLSQKN